MEKFSSLDDCIDQSHQTEAFAIANFIQGRSPKRQKIEDLRPIAFVCFNTSPQRSVVMEPMCCYSIKKYSNTIKLILLEYSTLSTVDYYVLSAPHALPDLCTVKEYEWQIRKLRDMATTSNILTTHRVKKHAKLH